MYLQNPLEGRYCAKTRLLAHTVPLWRVSLSQMAGSRRGFRMLSCQLCHCYTELQNPGPTALA